MAFFLDATFFLACFFFTGLLGVPRFVAGFLAVVSFFRLTVVFFLAFFLAAIGRSLPLL